MRARKHEHVVVQRPWGKFETLHIEEGFQVKRIEVKPGGRLSLQKHAQRAECWTVVTGVGIATVDGKQTEVKKGSVVQIPIGGVHRIHNTGSQDPLIFVEVQLGDYLGEDDIVRLEDDYNRA